MGNEQSRASADEDQEPHIRADVVQRLPDWSQLVSVPRERWTWSAMTRLGFDFTSRWQARKLKVHKWPWSKFSVSGLNNEAREEKLCSFTCEVSETGREEKMKGWVKDSSVVAFSNELIVVQVVLPKTLKLLVVNWRQGQLLGSYSFAYNKEPCYQECFLSPDGSMMLCRQDFLLRRCLNHVMMLDSFIRVIQIKDGYCKRLFIIEDYLAMGVLGSGISFHPAYPCRVTVLSSTQQAVSSRTSLVSSNQLMEYDLQQRQIVRESPSQTDRLIHHMTHSPDGKLLAVLCINVSVFLSIRTFLQCIDIYKTDTHDKLYVLSLYNERCKPSALSLYPMFSRNARALAVCSGEQSRTYDVYKLPCLNVTLQDHCRSAVRSVTTQDAFDQLPLPRRLISFLKYEPVTS